jgi:hypothetical protein
MREYINADGRHIFEIDPNADMATVQREAAEAMASLAANGATAAGALSEIAKCAAQCQPLSAMLSQATQHLPTTIPYRHPGASWVKAHRN